MMDVVIGVLAILAILTVTGAIIAHMQVTMRLARAVLAVASAVTTAAVESETAAPQPVRAEPRGDTRVTEPPMLDGVTLYQWLTTRSTIGENVWPQVVADFYNRAAGTPAVAAYFHSVEWEKLQNHFVRALVLVCDKGLTVGTLRYLREKHGKVKTLDGVAITGPVYDAVIQTLGGVLASRGVPERGINALVESIGPIRAEIVRA